MSIELEYSEQPWLWLYVYGGTCYMCYCSVLSRVDLLATCSFFRTQQLVLRNMVIHPVIMAL